MTDERATSTKTDVPVRVDPDRHREYDDKFGLADPLGDPGPQAPDDDPESVPGPLLRFLRELWGVAEPKTKKTVIVLGDDEQAHRLVSDTALVQLAGEISRFITSGSQRVEVAPSEGFSVDVTTVGTTTPARRVAGRQPDRVRLRIENLDDTNPIFIGSDLSVTSDTGFQIAAGGSIELATRAPVYAIASGGTVSIQVISEFGDPTVKREGK